MQEQHIRRARTPNARVRIFWHFESAPVRIERIGKFVQEVKSHLIDFKRIDLTAVATADFIKKDEKFTQTMNYAKIDLISVTDDGRAVQKIQNKMHDFYDDYHEDGCCMVLITGSYEFYRTIVHYKHTKSFRDLVLVYNAELLMTSKQSREEKKQTYRMKNLAPQYTPLSYFLGLIVSRSERVATTSRTAHAFDPNGSDTNTN